MLGLRPKLKARPSLVDLLVRSPGEGRSTASSTIRSDLDTALAEDHEPSTSLPAELHVQQQIASELPLPPDTPASSPPILPPHSSPSSSSSPSTPTPPTAFPTVLSHQPFPSSPSTDQTNHSDTPPKMPPVSFLPSRIRSSPTSPPA